eukprot:182538-Chlamydomonas_euryale.AAC.2
MERSNTLWARVSQHGCGCAAVVKPACVSCGMNVMVGVRVSQHGGCVTGGVNVWIDTGYAHGQITDLFEQLCCDGGIRAESL